MSQTLTEPRFYSVGAVAEIARVATWRIQRIFEDGTLKEPARFAGKRAIPAAMIPTIIDALRRRGWLPQPDESSGPAAQPATLPDAAPVLATV